MSTMYVFTCCHMFLHIRRSRCDSVESIGLIAVRLLRSMSLKASITVGHVTFCNLFLFIFKYAVTFVLYIAVV